MVFLAVRDIDRQPAGIGVPPGRMHDAGNDGKAGKPLRIGKAHFVAKGATIGLPGEQHALSINMIVGLHVVEYQQQRGFVPRMPGRTKRLGADEQIASAFGVF